MPSGGGFLLSVVIPVFNEAETIGKVLDAVLSTPFEKEVVVVDDGSADGTADFLRAYGDPRVRILFHEENRGKGAALQTGFREAKGDVVLIQDADLEYDPRDYPRLLEPILENRADVVYGSRFAGHGSRRAGRLWHYAGNRFLTLLSNLLTHLELTDMETCYKIFRREALEGISIEENRFGFEPEITAKIAGKKHLRICEVPVSYRGRTYREGKKINWKDGFRALWCILKYNLFRR
jgi:glycosyltransferase involved in cell wall biosynthesis